MALPMPTLPMRNQTDPLPRRPRRGPLVAGLAVAILLLAGLAAIVFWVGYASFQSPTAPRTSASTDTQAMAADGAFYPGDPDWWPTNIATAVGMFECRPASVKAVGSRASVVVWTGAANQVIAFAPARTGSQLPAYAASLAGRAPMDEGRAIQVAAQGHAVVSARRTSTLQLKDLRLACSRTWDD